MPKKEAGYLSTRYSVWHCLLTVVFLVFLALESRAQNIPKDTVYDLKISLYNTSDFKPVKEAFVSNLNTRKSVWSDADGYCSISAQRHHLIRIVYLSYETEFLQVAYLLKQKQDGDTISIPLSEKVYSIEQVEVYPFTKSAFRYAFLHQDIPLDQIDSLKKKIQASKEDLYVLKPYLAIPLNFKSKKEKQIIALEQYKKEQKKRHQFYLLAKNISQMEGQELCAFLQFCHFSSYYIQVNNWFVLARKLREKLVAYRYLKSYCLKKQYCNPFYIF